MTNGVLSVFVAVVLRDVGCVVRDLHLFVGNSGYNHVGPEKGERVPSLVICA